MTNQDASDVRIINLPYSEVCMHLGVAGTAMPARLVGDEGREMVQLLQANGRPFSLPIGRGEAGWDEQHTFGERAPQRNFEGPRDTAQRLAGALREGVLDEGTEIDVLSLAFHYDVPVRLEATSASEVNFAASHLQRTYRGIVAGLAADGHQAEAAALRAAVQETSQEIGTRV